MPASEFYDTASGDRYVIRHTGEVVGELCRVWGRRRAERAAAEANAARIVPSVTYVPRPCSLRRGHPGWRWRVVALQNELYKTIPERVLHDAEDVINAGFGLPPVWRCECGGRPFVGDRCPRCGRVEAT